MIIFEEDKPSPVSDVTLLDCLLLSDALYDNVVREGDEGTDVKRVIKSIQEEDFDRDTKAFEDSLNYAIKQIHGEYLSKRSFSSLQKCETYKVKGINAGFALSRMRGAPGLCEIVAVHNASPISRLGVYLMPVATRSMGGKYLECFGENLRGMYMAYGFEPYRQVDNVRFHGRLETVYFMKLKDVPAPL
jgi:hypothetical protein